MRPRRIRYNALQLNAFRQNSRGHGWTPIEHARNKNFHFWFNDLMLKRGGVQVGRRFTLALSACDRNEPGIEADSTLLGIAIAQAIIEGYRAGVASALR